MRVVKTRRSLGGCLYRLNPDYEFYGELLSLLDRIAEIRLLYADAAAIETEVFKHNGAARQRGIVVSRPEEIVGRKARL
jgi:hypothetical protein